MRELKLSAERCFKKRYRLRRKHSCVISRAAATIRCFHAWNADIVPSSSPVTQESGVFSARAQLDSTAHAQRQLAAARRRCSERGKRIAHAQHITTWRLTTQSYYKQACLSQVEVLATVQGIIGLQKKKYDLLLIQMFRCSLIPSFIHSFIQFIFHIQTLYPEGF